MLTARGPLSGVGETIGRVIEPRWVTDLPIGVTVYANPYVYIAEDLDREATGALVAGDLDGWDVGEDFRLSETAGTALPESLWRISLRRGEVYAMLRKFPWEQTYTFDGLVWAIAQIPPQLRAEPGQLVQAPAVEELMAEVRRRRREPDSLLTAVALIQNRLRELADSDAL